MPIIADLLLTITPATALYTNPIPDAQIKAYESVNEGRNAVVLDFNSGAGLYARDFETTFSWPTAEHLVLYVWQPSLVMLPEGIFGRASDWDDSGSQGNKFYQGVLIEGDSFNASKTFFLQDSDTLTMHPLNECPTTFNGQTEKAFSCTPFTAHSARIISSDGVEWRVWGIRYVFQPWPESTINWQTEMTSMGLTGWGHVREMNIPYVSSTIVTLNLTFDAWPTITLTLPSTAGIQAKTKVTLPPNKFKLIGLQASSAATFNLFRDDLELKIRQWGAEGPYNVVKPFGGPSRTGATV